MQYNSLEYQHLNMKTPHQKKFPFAIQKKKKKNGQKIKEIANVMETLLLSKFLTSNAWCHVQSLQKRSLLIWWLKSHEKWPWNAPIFCPLLKCGCGPTCWHLLSFNTLLIMKCCRQQASLKGLSDKQPTFVHYLLDCNFSSKANPIIAQFLHK